MDQQKKSYQFYESILKERGLSSYRVSMETRVPQSSFSLWKLYGVTPRFEKMSRIAAYLSTEDRPLKAQDFLEKDLPDADAEQ